MSTTLPSPGSLTSDVRGSLRDRGLRPLDPTAGQLSYMIRDLSMYLTQYSSPQKRRLLLQTAIELERLQAVEAGITELSWLQAADPSLAELQEELRITDKLLEGREQVLRAVPACPAHGNACIPHALEWLQRAVGLEAQMRRFAEALLITTDGVKDHHMAGEFGLPAAEGAALVATRQAAIDLTRKGADDVVGSN